MCLVWFFYSEVAWFVYYLICRCLLCSVVVLSLGFHPSLILHATHGQHTSVISKIEKVNYFGIILFFFLNISQLFWNCP